MSAALPSILRRCAVTSCAAPLLFCCSRPAPQVATTDEAAESLLCDEGKERQLQFNSVLFQIIQGAQPLDRLQHAHDLKVQGWRVPLLRLVVVSKWRRPCPESASKTSPTVHWKNREEPRSLAADVFALRRCPQAVPPTGIQSLRSKSRNLSTCVQEVLKRIACAVTGRSCVPVPRSCCHWDCFVSTETRTRLRLRPCHVTHRHLRHCRFAHSQPPLEKAAHRH